MTGSPRGAAPCPAARARRPGRTAAALAVAALLTAGGLGGSASPAAAGGVTASASTEVYPVPASGVFDVSGHGWGHGRGMSQWGAQGAALRGVDSATILGAYYRGTASTAVPEDPARPLRVALTRNGGEGRPPTGSINSDHRYECDSGGRWYCRLEVLPAPGLTAQDGAGAPVVLPASVPTGSGTAPAQSWAVGNDDAGLHLSAWADGAWRPFALGGSTTSAGPITFAGAPTLRMQYLDLSVHEYRGTLSAVRTSAGTMARVDNVAREDYLRSVIGKEMPPSWRPAALEAQTVAARSYAEQYRQSRPGGSAWDICDSTYCQVYSGKAAAAPGGPLVAQEYASTDAAVARTANLVRTYGGAVIRAEFSASNGGWTVAGSSPYLPAQHDGWDDAGGSNPNFAWSARLPASAIEQRFPSVGRLTAVAVTSRDGNGDWGGRVLGVELRGVAGDGTPTSVQTTGESLRLAYGWPAARDGMRSNWWVIRSVATALTGAWGRPDGAVELGWTRPDGAVAVGTARGDTVGAKVDLGGQARGGPALAGRSNGELDLFVRGTDDQLWTARRAAGGTWSGWQPLGGSLTAAPSATASGGIVHVVVVGGDRQLWHRYSTAPGRWSNWYPLGGVAASAPAVAFGGPNRLDALVQGTDGAVWRRSWAGTWQPWTSLGGRVDGAVGAAAGGSGPVVLARGTDLAGWTRTDTAPWSSLGGGLLAAPAGAAVPGRVDAYAVGLDGAFFVTSLSTSPTGGAPGAGWTGWRRLG